MKKKSSQLNSTALLPRIRVDRLLQAIRSELGATYPTLARMAGPGRATLHDWAGGQPAEQIEALIRLLARIPRETRHRIVDEACPTMPSLDHPYIARNRLVTAYLRDLLEKKTGVTLVTGESEYLRWFMATALAHTMAAEEPNRTIVLGYDIHELNRCVPVPGVTYLGRWTRSNGLDALSRTLQIEPSRLVYLNGVYSRAPGLRARIQKLSGSCHVLLAERNMSPREVEAFHLPASIVTVSVDASVDAVDDAARMLIRIGETGRNPSPAP